MKTIAKLTMAGLVAAGLFSCAKEDAVKTTEDFAGVQHGRITAVAPGKADETAKTEGSVALVKENKQSVESGTLYTLVLQVDGKSDTIDHVLITANGNNNGFSLAIQKQLFVDMDISGGIFLHPLFINLNFGLIFTSPNAPSGIGLILDFSGSSDASGKLNFSFVTEDGVTVHFEADESV